MTILTVAQYRTLTLDIETSDNDIQSALDIYTSIIEDYCNQVFGAADYTDTYNQILNDPLILNRANVNSITSITVDDESADTSAFDRDDSNGFIYHEGVWITKTVVIEYNAGLTAPASVKHVLATLVKGYLSGLTGGLNALRPIVKETTYGVESHQYEATPMGGHAELSQFTSILDKYRIVELA